jgi:hypothetical protein
VTKVIKKDAYFQWAARRCVIYQVVGGGGSKHDWETIEQEAVKQFSSVVCTGDKSFVLKIQGADAGFSVTKEDSLQFCLYYAPEAAKAPGDLEVADILHETNVKMKKQYR